MSRIISFVLVWLAAQSLEVSSLFSQSTDSSPDSPSPEYNVLMIMIDDLRTEIGSYRGKSDNYSVEFTPNLDAFAKTAVQFERAYVQVALCGPSRASIFTGRTARSLNYFQHNLNDVEDDEILEKSPIPNLPKYFQQNGYVTRGGGKVFHRDSNLNEFQQFRTSRSVQCPCSSARRNCPKMICTVPDSEKNKLTDSPIVEWGVEQLQRFAKSGQKFFMSLGIRKPHLPYRVPASNLAKITQLFGANLQKMHVPYSKHRVDDYSVANYYCDAMDQYLSAIVNARTTARRLSASDSDSYETEGLNLSRSAGNNNVLDVTVSTQLGAPVVDDELIKQLKLGYFAAVNWADELFGVIDKAMESLDLYKNTVVMVLSDNGFNLGEQGNYCKNSNYENSAKVPLLIRHPKGMKNVRRSEIVSLVDLYPTILDLARPEVVDSPTKALLHGKSFSDLVISNLESNEEEIDSNEVEHVAFSAISRCWNENTKKLLNCNKMSDINVMGFSVRTKNFRYTEWRSAKQIDGKFSFETEDLIDVELFDHSNNPDPDVMETINLVTLINQNLRNLPTLVVKSGETETEYNVAYLNQLMKVFSNLLEAQYTCADLECVPILQTLPPTLNPTESPTEQPTNLPTTFTPTGFPSVTKTISPSTKPLDDSNDGNQDNQDLQTGGYGAAMSAGISIVIMLACLAIAVVVVLWTKKSRADRQRAERLRKQTSWQRISKPV